MLQEGLILTVVSGPSSCSILLFLLACGTRILVVSLLQTGRKHPGTECRARAHTHLDRLVDLNRSVTRIVESPPVPPWQPFSACCTARRCSARCCCSHRCECCDGPQTGCQRFLIICCRARIVLG